MKIIPLADRVVIKTVEVEETTKGGLILTGPTGTNVNDLSVLLIRR
jgi:co-chaperonin GroES (HSP10)